MPLTRTRRDVQFWRVVDGLEWKLDDGSGGPPPQQPPFDRGGGGGGVWPKWATHLIAFLLGGITWSSLLLAPVLMPAVVLASIIGFVVLAVRGRWR